MTTKSAGSIVFSEETSSVLFVIEPRHSLTLLYLDELNPLESFHESEDEDMEGDERMWGYDGDALR